MMTMDDVKAFVERCLENAESKYTTTAEEVRNYQAQAFGVIMFTQKFLPYDELEKYWEGEDGIWRKFNDVARGKADEDN